MLSKSGSPKIPSETNIHSAPERPPNRNPPPLPPRAGTIHLTPYSQTPLSHSLSEQDRQTTEEPWFSQDPRSSSTHSLVPSESAQVDKRTLLLIYIHGFLGNESSFQSFPAHVHNLLTITLADTHAVHTKIYPQYKSRKAIEFARDAFSEWLAPHESSETDIVLLGHSMGGILSAEVVLLSPSGAPSGPPFRHCLLGTVNFDTPFLGMHPGVVVSGIGSLFRPAPDPPGTKPKTNGAISGVNQQPQAQKAESTSQSLSPTMLSLSTVDSQDSAANSQSYFGSTSTTPITPTTSVANSMTSPLTSPITDPNYNPPFPNDVRIPIRSGWNNALHFVVKHSDGLTRATRQYFTSHLEFGGCLADYNALKTRYARIRALEDVNELDERASTQGARPVQRRRFVNYYTASTGRPKKPKAPSPQGAGRSRSSLSLDGAEKNVDSEVQSTRSRSRSPRISVEEHRDDKIISKEPHIPEDQATREELDTPEEQAQMNHVDSISIDDSQDNNSATPATKAKSDPTSDTTIEILPRTAATDDSSTSSPQDTLSFALPPLPPVPTEPPPLDTTQFTSKDARKLAEKEHSRALKAYKQALSDRSRALKDRQKLLEKRDKKARQERSRVLKAEEKQRVRAEKELLKTTTTHSNGKEKNGLEEAAGNGCKADKKKRDRKFCLLPPKGSADGKRDSTWVRVYMEGVDEVGAHCGLFFMSEAYEMLVGDVAARIEEWVREEGSRRVVGEMGGLG
ncbi:MAG: hypothetical protein M1836_007359 [Candelina mexicana]|nr:MAG: hypothetical protein M1836_007359 [Candelina mexicana]